jgi:glyoxylase-like metal-dependent hydrolase (beta-lactamase superfamily II)
MLRFLLAITSAAVFAGCAVRQPSSSSPPLRLYALDCGTIEVRDMSFFAGVRGERQMLADPCFLIVHPKGMLLWDTGLPDELARMPEGKPVMDFITFHVTRTLARQLEEIGVAADAVNYLGISHMHLDHVGNAPRFPRATLLLQREEYDAAFGPDPRRYGLDPSTYATLRSNPVRKLQGDMDVFGDGTVIIKRAPGHTPGHQALFVKLRTTGNVLLSGDAAHLTENWVHRRVPAFNHDSAQSVRTMDDLAAFAEAQHAAIWIQHDPTQSAGIRRAPAFYE